MREMAHWRRRCSRERKVFGSRHHGGFLTRVTTGSTSTVVVVGLGSLVQSGETRKRVVVGSRIVTRVASGTSLLQARKHIAQVVVLTTGGPVVARHDG